MTLGVLVFIVFRVATSLPVLRWPLAGAPILTDKDRRGAPLASAETFA